MTESVPWEVVCREAQISARVLDYWTQEGYLVATRQAGTGRGSPRRWTIAEMHIAALMRRLTEVGFEAGSAAIYARQVENPAVAHTVILGRGMTLTITDGAS